MDALQRLDARVSYALAICKPGAPLERLRPFCIAIEWLWHGIPWLIGVFLAIIWTHSTRWDQFWVNVMSGLLLDLALVGLLKITFRRARPAINQDDMVAPGPGDAYSFPSGHASRAVFLCTLFAKATPHATEHDFLIPLVLLAILTTFSRVFIGRHYALDVIAGCALGAFEAWLVCGKLWLPENTTMHVFQFLWGVLEGTEPEVKVEY